MSIEDERTFAKMFREQHTHVRQRLRRRGIAVADLDDLVQETFIIAYRLRSQLQAYGEARRWLSAIAWRCASNWRRRVRRRAKYHAAYGGQQLVVGTVQRVCSPQRVELDQCLSMLTASRRDLVLCHGMGYTALEIAARFGINPNTVRSRLFAARRDLARRTEEGRGRRAARRN